MTNLLTAALGATRSWRRPSPPQVWTVEHDALQVCWGSLPAGPVTLTAGAARGTLEHPGGAGALTLEGLEPATDHEVTLSFRDGSARLGARTLPRPPGAELARIATVSDLHLGATRWGFFKTMTDRRAGLDDHPEAVPYRCARAAIAEAVAWGAQHLVVKGDGAHHRVPAHFDELGRLVDEFPDLPMTLLPGNHDVDDREPIPLPATVGARALPYVRSHESLDVDGLRLIAGDTTIEGDGKGTIERHGDAILALAAEAPSAAGVLVATHQQFQRSGPLTYWPPGIAPPASVDFLLALDRARPGSVVTSGHTHRNRVRRQGTTVHTEVAATRDWPGVWAAYTVFEGGIQQSVRRIAAPEAATWHEYSKDAVMAVWQHWAPGDLDDRSLLHRWP